MKTIIFIYELFFYYFNSFSLTYPFDIRYFFNIHIFNYFLEFFFASNAVDYFFRASISL